LESPGEEITIDLEHQTVKFADGWQAVFEVEPFARRCLLDGVDAMGFLIERLPEIEAFEKRNS
jgi:3-isopropylmalate/(R)-2-methylmalate dehydratase small subunit